MIATQLRTLFVILPTALLAACGFAHAAPADTSPLPTFAAVEKIVTEHFAAAKDHRAKDLIARGDVQPLYVLLERAGWKVADQKQIQDSLLSDQHVLVKKLRTSAGKKFMRQVAGDPEVYDRLDRFVRLPRGERMLQDLIDGPDGHKLLDYMTKTQGGKELGKMLSDAPRGRDFNDQTGRIYTVKTLVERLKSSHAQAEKQAAR